MSNLPMFFELMNPHFIPSCVDNHIIRRLSSLQGQFFDSKSFNDNVSDDDAVVYEVYEIKRPEETGEMLMGVSIVHPGKVGQEFFMTKGHYHQLLNTAEVYYCLKGEGFMVMENPEGESAVESLLPGRVLYVPPRWAHRSVCTSRQDDLITFFIYPANAGHDYSTIEKEGFRKLVIEKNNAIEIIDNPKWNKVRKRQS